MIKRCAFLLALLFVFAAPSHAKFDPSFSWSTLETAHFHIHFHQGANEAAARAAAIAEDAHARLAPRVVWEPREKTHLVLVDATDEPNGYASPVPYNRIVVYLTPPLGQPDSGAERYDDWLRLVIVHEYTHILQLDMITGGLGSAFQAVFGRIYFPNLFQPEWLIEGLATYEETEQTAGGRGRSPVAEMVLRMAVLDNAFPTLDRMAAFPDTWPAGKTPYLFGESFTRFIAEKYGRDKLAEISRTYSGRGFPFLVDQTARRVLPKDYGHLWADWELSLAERFAKQEAVVRAAGLTLSDPLTRKGYYAVAPAFSPDGSRIAYSVSNNDEFPGIYVMNADGSNGRKMVENMFPMAASGAGISWGPDGTKLYYTKNEVRGSNYYNDVYCYDLAKDRERRLTADLRGRDPHPSSDGKRLVFVMSKAGMTRLAALDIERSLQRPAEEKDVEFLSDWGALQYGSPSFSPDGTRIAVAVRGAGGNPDVWILDARGAKLDAVTNDRAVDGAPAWSSDGRVLYFSSDRSGIFNVYAYELATKRLSQVTNVLGGAFMPAPAPDGTKLAFSSYGSRGYDIMVMPIAAASAKPAPAFVDDLPPLREAENPVEAAVRPYSPWSTLSPRFWLPWFSYSRSSGALVGAFTEGYDAVEHHLYSLTALYGPEHGRTWYAFDYFYDGLYPTIHFEASDQDIAYSEFFRFGTLEKDYEEREKTVGLSAQFPLVRYATQQYLTFGYRWKELDPLTEAPLWYRGAQPGSGVLASGRVAYLFNSSREYGFSISPEEGRKVSLGYERFDESLGSDYEIHKYTVDWHEYVPMPWPHHVLSVRAFAGSSTGADALKLPQRAFQLGGDSYLENPQDAVVTVGEQDVYLRGYPVNEFRGRKAALLSAEYRIPLWNVERGAGSLPYFLKRIHAAFFAEAGNAWDGTFRHSDLKRSVGAELRFDLTIAYFVPVTVRVGIASGLDEEGETVPTFGVIIPLSF